MAKYYCKRCDVTFSTNYEHCPNCGKELITIPNDKDIQNIESVKQPVSKMKMPLVFKLYVIFSIVFFILGLALIITMTYANLNKAFMSNMCFFGMGFISFALLIGAYLVLNPNFKVNIFIKILVIAATIGIEFGLYFVFNRYMMQNMARFDADEIGIKIGIVSTLGTSGLMIVSYVLFHILKKSDNAYFIFLLIGPLVALVATAIANIIHITGLFWIPVLIIIFIAYLIIAKVTDSPYEPDYDYGYYTTKYYLEDGTELHESSPGRYFDDYGNHYVSDDGGSTCYKDDRLLLIK